MLAILFIGDIVGKAGRQCVRKVLNEIVKEYNISFVIANGENAAGGFGITPKITEELLAAGIHVLTSGNHIWKQKDILDYIHRQKRLLRPLNYPPGTPGTGSYIGTLPGGTVIAVLNVAGRVFMEMDRCPFRSIDDALKEIVPQTNLIVVDVHAEATSEKRALGWYLDGKVSAVLGTHTHIQTADEQILPQGTAYITDVGMTGARDSVIGMKKELVIQKFLTSMPVRFESSRKDPWLNGVIVTVNEQNGTAVNIKRVQYSIENA